MYVFCIKTTDTNQVEPNKSKKQMESDDDMFERFEIVSS